MPSPAATRLYATDTAADRSQQSQSKEVVDKPQDAQSTDSGSFASWRRKQYGTSNAQSSPAKQLLELTQQSLAASGPHKTVNANADQTANAYTAHEMQDHRAAASYYSSSFTWDGPTVWAHLW